MSLTDDVQRQLLAWTADAAPNETCGVIIDDMPYQIRNLHEDPRHHFRPDLDQLVELVEAHGEPEAVWHSHPDGNRHPSVNDLQFHPPGVRLVLVVPGEVIDHGDPTA